MAAVNICDGGLGVCMNGWTGVGDYENGGSNYVMGA